MHGEGGRHDGDPNRNVAAVEVDGLVSCVPSALGRHRHLPHALLQNLHLPAVHNWA